jgi:hypothetical protein
VGISVGGEEMGLLVGDTEIGFDVGFIVEVGLEVGFVVVGFVVGIELVFGGGTIDGGTTGGGSTDGGTTGGAVPMLAKGLVVVDEEYGLSVTRYVG